jgi:hypothetical protein
MTAKSMADHSRRQPNEIHSDEAEEAIELVSSGAFPSFLTP